MSEELRGGEGQGRAERPRTSGRRVLLVMGLGLLVLAVAGVIGRTITSGLVEQAKKARRIKCAVNLRDLALAAQQYADEKRGFPHVGARDRLDGGIDSPDTPLLYRRLAAQGYLSSPEVLLCPARPRINRRSQAQGPGDWWTESPEEPPPLSKLQGISYGFTRRALSRTARGDRLLAADKAAIPRRGPEPAFRGNHTEGWNVAAADGSVEWYSIERDPFPGKVLASTEPGGGFLSILPQGDPELFR